MTDKLSAEELVAGLERIERTMREKWEDYGVDILAAARARIAEAERMREALVATAKQYRDGDVVETVARALCWEAGNNPDDLASIDGGPFERYWKAFEAEARAALKEQPTAPECSE